MAHTAHSHQFDFSGGDVCLDFVNTLGDRPRGHEEHLDSWRDLVDWAEQGRLLPKREAAALRSTGAARGAATEAAFERAVALRECLYRIFRSVAAARTPARQDLAALNEALAGVLGHARIETHGHDFVWTWAPGEPSLDRLLWPVVRAAGDLLASPARTQIRECASGTCSWLFIDNSPTRRRRWCSMKTCGNRDKVRRFYERKTQTKTQRPA
jgi:predicted RNA-binding Zn ribbon-like protein